jgi:HlyD family secretion protein
VPAHHRERAATDAVFVAGEQREPLRHILEHNLSSELRRGGRVLAIAGAIVLGWAGVVPLSGAVIVGGSLVVHSEVKKVQHPSGGIVAAIAIRNGSKVEAGQELVRLDETSARTNLQVIARQLDEVRLRIARLNAERDGVQPDWPVSLAADLDATERKRLYASERNFFATRASARRNEKELTESRVKQLEKQIGGLEAQLESNNAQLDITRGELKGVEGLLREKIVTIQRATALQREAARLDGIGGQLASQIAEIRGKMNEAELQSVQAEQNFRSEVMRDLNEAASKEGELIERRLAAEDQLRRTIVRAPTSGTIHDLGVHTAGGVVAPGEVLMTLVPDGDALEVDARLGPEKIDQVRIGQTARIRLSAFNAGTTPEISGTVDFVSPDLVRDSQTGARYYNVRIALRQDEVRRLANLQLVPGMPAEAFLQTESRTMLSYFFKPVTDQLARMFRER